MDWLVILGFPLVAYILGRWLFLREWSGQQRIGVRVGSFGLLLTGLVAKFSFLFWPALICLILSVFVFTIMEISNNEKK